MIDTVAPASAEPRVVRGPLMLGLIAMPIVFVWFLFLPGFTRSLRWAALAYAFAWKQQLPPPTTLAGVALLVAGVAWALRIKPVAHTG